MCLCLCLFLCVWCSVSVVHMHAITNYCSITSLYESIESCTYITNHPMFGINATIMISVSTVNCVLSYCSNDYTCKFTTASVLQTHVLHDYLKGTMLSGPHCIGPSFCVDAMHGAKKKLMRSHVYSCIDIILNYAPT